VVYPGGVSTFVIAPAGVSPAGFFAPAVFVSPARPPALLADDIALNHPTLADGDFASLLTFVHPVDAAVKTQFRLRLGTGAAVLEDGNKLATIKKVGSATPREVEDEYRRLLKSQVDRGDIAIETVVVETDVNGQSDTVGGFVEYTNRVRGTKGNKV